MKLQFIFSCALPAAHINFFENRDLSLNFRNISEWLSVAPQTSDLLVWDV